ncbi:HAMP domain-containing protein [bacterium]|nr:HAMP domain-containing protein [bacterium]
MKIQYKAFLLISLFGIIIISILSWGYNVYNAKIILNKEFKNIKNIAEEISLHMQSILIGKTVISKTLSSAPVIKDFLLKSNVKFGAFSPEKQKQEIERLNRKWIETEDINDPFIKSYMTNSVSEFLKSQQTIVPDEYGEIFLTNKYGVMISTTGKLTTLAHSHKYWWQAGYHNGKGRIFLDDRGYDTSVQGYVIGVVIPIKYENEIIGILKSNVNIMGPLTHAIQEFSQRSHGIVEIVRTSGLVVAGNNVKPLTKKLSNFIVNKLKLKKLGTAMINVQNKNLLVAYDPLKVTLGSDSIGFGGSKESIDHIKGNKGDAWHIVITLDEKKAFEIVRETGSLLILFGVIVTFFAACIAFLLAKLLAKPLVELAITAKSIGEGNLDTQAMVKSKDEIGSLAKTINEMANNLKITMASRDEVESINNELQEALDNVKTLSGLIPICSSCKKIRDDEGTWNRLEEYISNHTDAQFSHGICNDCVKKLYGDLDLYKKKLD